MPRSSARETEEVMPGLSSTGSDRGWRLGDREALRRSVRDQAYHIAKATRGDDRMPASRGIRSRAKLAHEMIGVFLVCLLARVPKTEVSYS